MAPRETHSEDDLSMLTAAEREGLLDADLVDEGADEEVDDDQVGTDAAAAAVVEAQAKTDAKIEAGTDEAAKEALAARRQAEADAKTEADAAKAEAEAAKQALADAAAGKTVEPAPVVAATPAAAVAAPAPVFPTYVAPPDAKEKLDDIETKLAEIDRKFDDGELTAVERRAQLRPLEDEKATLREAVNRAAISKDAADNQWLQVSVPTFLSAHPEYDAKTNPALFKALDARVRQMQVEAAAEGKHRDPAILERAHKALQDEARALLGVKETPKPNPKPTPTPGKDGRKIPPSLAFVPAADMSDNDEGNDFAWLDRLSETNPEAFQQQLAKLSKEDSERYLAQ